ncbi:MAG: hypothetical protein H7A37_10225 [Chlamydiales bacterium]|nr:hypothetical protein [Chlamydiia bacterium]MCP5508653.1 hypothetical protein [Chlamydiales bacterium]
MIIKRYQASSLEEAESLVRQKHGPEAIILSHVKSDDGASIIVTIGIEEKKESKPAIPVANPVDDEDEEQEPDVDSILQRLEGQLGGDSEEEQEYEIALPQNKDVTISTADDAVEECVEEKIMRKPLQNDGSCAFLISRGVNAETASKISECLQQQFPDVVLDEASKERTDYLHALRNEVAKKIAVKAPLACESSRPTLVAVVGNAGTGKTTTLIKLATKFIHEYDKSAAIISIDAAQPWVSEQVEVLAGHFGLPYSLACTAKELEEAISAFSHYDLILIDTTSHGCNQKEQVENLSLLLNPLNDLHVLLVLSAHTRDADTYRILRDYASIAIDSLVVTKLDETIQPGVLINISQKSGIPVSYISVGQQVPDSLQAAEPEKLAHLVLFGVEKTGLLRI